MGKTHYFMIYYDCFPFIFPQHPDFAKTLHAPEVSMLRRAFQATEHLGSLTVVLVP